MNTIASQQFRENLEYLNKYVELHKKIKKSRKRKYIVRKVFNKWYKIPNINGDITEDYWKLKINGDNITFREWLAEHIKLLRIHQCELLFKELCKRHMEKNS